MGVIQIARLTECQLASHLYDSAVEAHHEGVLATRLIQVDGTLAFRAPSDFTFCYYLPGRPNPSPDALIGLATLDSFRENTSYFSFHPEDCFEEFYERGIDPYYLLAGSKTSRLKILRTGHEVNSRLELQQETPHNPNSSRHRGVTRSIVTGVVYDISKAEGLELFNEEIARRLEIQRQILEKNPRLAEPDFVLKLRAEIRMRMHGLYSPLNKHTSSGLNNLLGSSGTK